jgi:hypothetical protein
VVLLGLLVPRPLFRLVSPVLLGAAERTLYLKAPMLLGCLGEKLGDLMVAKARGHAPEVFQLRVPVALRELARAGEHALDGVQKARRGLVRGAQHFPLPAPFLPLGAGLLVLVSFLAVLVFVALMMIVLRLGAAGALRSASP